MKALLLIFSLLLTLLLVGLWVGSGSYPQRWGLDERITAQQAENKDKKAQITKMQTELEDVKSGHAAIEERARSELGMTGEGETYFEVILQPDQSQNDQNKKSKTEADKSEKNKPIEQ